MSAVLVVAVLGTADCGYGGGIGVEIGGAIERAEGHLPVAFFRPQRPLALFQGIVGGWERLLARGQDLFKGSEKACFSAPGWRHVDR